MGRPPPPGSPGWGPKNGEQKANTLESIPGREAPRILLGAVCGEEPFGRPGQAASGTLIAMCGAGGTKRGIQGVFKRLVDAEWDEAQEFAPNPNIRPTLTIPGVRLTDHGRVAGNYIWGFMPPNAPSKKFISEWSTFNARDDKIAKSKLYSKPFRESRSLVALSVWYEWPKQPGEKKGIPCTVKPTQAEIFVFGGVWGPWKDPETQLKHDTTTMITTSPNAVIADLPHHRMPAILPPAAWEEWLHPDTPVSVLQDMLHPTPDEWLEIIPKGPTSFSVD